MSTNLLRIDSLAQACHAALRSGRDEQVISFLMRTLNTAKLSVPENEKSLVRGLANLAAAQADILLRRLQSQMLSSFTMA